MVKGRAVLELGLEIMSKTNYSVSFCGRVTIIDTKTFKKNISPMPKMLENDRAVFRIHGREGG